MSLQILNRMRKQQACYWAPGPPDASGRLTYSAPVQLRVRWEVMESEIVDAKGRTLLLQDRVFTDVDLEKGGVLWLGLLADVETPNTKPFLNDGAVEIKKFFKIPNIKATKFLRYAVC